MIDLKNFEILNRQEILLEVFKKFPRRDKVKIFIITVFSISLSILDLIGVALLGVVGTLSVSGIQSSSPGGPIQTILNFAQISNLSFQNQVAILAISATLALSLKTVLSIIISRRTLRFFATRAAQTSVELTGRLLNTDLEYIQSRPTQEFAHSLTAGTSALMLGVFAVSINLLGDITLLIVLAVALLYVNPVVAISSIVFFGLVALIMHILLNVRAERLGAVDASLNIASNSAITEMIGSFRELIVHDKKEYYVNHIKTLRTELAFTQVETTFMPNISKYIVESALILGAVLISAIQFFTTDAASAVATLAIFLAAGSRLAPALLRIQQGSIQMRNNLGASRKTLALMCELPPLSHDAIKASKNENSFIYGDFIPGIEISDLEFKYSEITKNAIVIRELTVSPGEMIAIVGPSGAGKTTLIDVILGILKNASGRVLISGLPSAEAIAKWPGAVSYVPQETFIADATIAENIALGFEESEINYEFVRECVQKAELNEWVSSLQDGFYARVGERGTQLSGGQRQRLGIARALYTKPRLLILDEATSSLDAETEFAISNTLRELKGNVTLLIIAHRLSTIMDADKVIYVEDGEIKAAGSFIEVRNQIPNFDTAAKIMGL